MCTGYYSRHSLAMMSLGAPSRILVISSSNVLLPGSGVPQPACITIDISTGKITDIQHNSHNPQTSNALKSLHIQDHVNWLDLRDKLILPGLVDAHVHLNEPGRTDWEGFWTGTRAAASGGVTTVVDMPLNSIPPTTTVENLEKKRAAARGQCFTDVAFWGGVIPGNQAHLKPLVSAGVKGFKCFLIESGVEEFPCVKEQDLSQAMHELEETSTVLLFHAELGDTISITEGSSHHPTLYTTFLDSRPEKLEIDAIHLITSLQRSYPGLRCHIVHLSASSALPLIRAAKSSGLKLTVETCYHYLCLSSNDIPNGKPEYKCCPPIRNAENRDLLWAALQDGLIDCIVSDHSPCVTELKKIQEGDIMSAWGGISTLGLGLSLLWTEGRKRGVSIAQIIEWTSRKTAEHAGLGSSKGQLRIGFDADIIVWDPEAEFLVSKDSLNFKNKLSPYEGLTLRGRVEKTFLRGRLVYDKDAGDIIGSGPAGVIL